MPPVARGRAARPPLCAAAAAAILVGVRTRRLRERASGASSSPSSPSPPAAASAAAAAAAAASACSRRCVSSRCLRASATAHSRHSSVAQRVHARYCHQIAVPDKTVQPVDRSLSAWTATKLAVPQPSHSCRSPSGDSPNAAARSAAPSDLGELINPHQPIDH